MTITCPKCTTTTMIEMKTSDHVTLDFCEQCNGLWFDRDELADYLGLTSDIVEFDAVKDQAKATELVCPKCSKQLVELPFSSHTDLLIELCSGCHGIFFDFREVGEAQIVAADLESSSVRLKVIKQRFFQKGFDSKT